METDFAGEIAELRSDIERQNVTVFFSTEPQGSSSGVDGATFTQLDLDGKKLTTDEVQLLGRLWDHEMAFWLLAHEAGHAQQTKAYVLSRTPAYEILEQEMSAWIWALQYASVRGIIPSPRALYYMHRAYHSYVEVLGQLGR